MAKKKKRKAFKPEFELINAVEKEVKFHSVNGMFCRTYYSDAENNMYCAQEEGAGRLLWYTVAPGHYMEPDYPVRDIEFKIVESFKGDAPARAPGFRSMPQSPLGPDQYISGA